MTFSSRISRRQFALGLGAAAAVAPFGLAMARADDIDLSSTVLRIGDQTGATRAKLEAAGLLDDVPYQIDWSVFAAAVNLHEALKADATDIGSSADAPAVSAIAGGSRIKIASAWSNGGKGRSIVVPADSDIETLADLRGKTISPTTRGSIGHFLVLNALKSAGVDESEVTLAFLTPADASAAFQSGDIDAWGTWGIYGARTVGALGARVLTTGEGLLSGLFVLNATDNALADEAKVAAIADFSERIEAGYEWSRNNPEDWITFYSEFSRQDRELSAALHDDDASYRRVPNDDELGAQLQNTFDTWVEAGVLSGELDLNDYVFRGLS